MKQITPDLPTLRIFEPREFQEEVLKCIKLMLKDFSGLPLNESILMSVNLGKIL